MFPEIAEKRVRPLGVTRRAPQAVCFAFQLPRPETADPGIGKNSVVSSGRGVARGTVDGRHCQWPWEGFKADGNGLYGIGLEAEEFVVS